MNTEELSKGKRDKIQEALQINRSSSSIASELIASIKKTSLLFSSRGLCGKVDLKIYPDRYFIAQEYNAKRDDLRKAIEISLKKFGFSSIAADDFYLSEIILCKIAGLIQGTHFGIYQLTESQNRNVYLELGIAIALEKHFILVKDINAEPADCIRDIEYYPINSYLDVKHKLGNALDKQITSIAQCQLSEKTPGSDNQSTEVLIYHGDTESVDITVALAKELKEQRFSPVILGRFNLKLAEYLRSEANTEPKFIQSREKIIGAIQKAKFGIFRTHKTASTDNFFAMGIAIGLNRPFFPIKHEAIKMPSDLGSITPLIYSSYSDLEKKMAFQFSNWYENTFPKKK